MVGVPAYGRRGTGRVGRRGVGRGCVGGGARPPCCAPTGRSCAPYSATASAGGARPPRSTPAGTRSWPGAVATVCRSRAARSCARSRCAAATIRPWPSPPRAARLIAWCSDDGIATLADGVVDPDAWCAEIAAAVTDDGAAVIAHHAFQDGVRVLGRLAGGAWSAARSVAGEWPPIAPLDYDGERELALALGRDGCATLAWKREFRVFGVAGRAGGAWGAAGRSPRGCVMRGGRARTSMILGCRGWCGTSRISAGVAGRAGLPLWRLVERSPKPSRARGAGA